MEKLHDFYELACKRAPISRESWDIFAAKLDFHDVKKADFLVRPGNEKRVIFIVMEGVARNYCLDEKGREYTKTFRGPGGVIGPYAEILEGVPSRYFIQAVTDLKCLSFQYSFYEKMMEDFPDWQGLCQKNGRREFHGKRATRIYVTSTSCQ